MFRYLFPLLIFGFLQTISFGQLLPEYNMSDGLIITDCQGILYDSGGENGTYGQSENISTTIQTNGPITLSFFNQICIQNNFDYLYVYDGTDNTGPLLGQFTGVNLPSDITGTSGAVTLVFTSDQNVAYCGFSIEWTSILPPPPAPTMSVIVNSTCGSSTIQVNYDQVYPCAIFEAANFTVSNQNESFDVTQIAGCSGGLTQTTFLTLDHPLAYSCLIHIELHVEITDPCGIVYPFDISTDYNFVACPINAVAVSDDTQICIGECTNVSVETIGCTNYTYSWNQGLPATAGPHTVCPTTNTTYTVTVTDPNTGASVVKNRAIQVTSAAITTPAQNICQSANDIVMQATGLGTWSGEGLENNSNVFDPDSIPGGGITYIYYQTSGCLDSVQFNILPIQAEEYTAACLGSPVFQLEAAPLGGTWSGTNTTLAGQFNPQTLGTFDAVYQTNGCTDTTRVNVGPIGGTFTLDTLCQSDGLDTIQFSPPGGYWTGPGLVNDSLGIFSPEQTPGGDIQYTYNINGCNQIFNIHIKPIDIGGRFHTTCPEEAPLVWYPGAAPIPTGGVWSGAGVINFSTGLFDPGNVPNNSYNDIYYNAPNGCADTITIFNLQTTITLAQMSLCLGDNPFNLTTEEIGFFGPGSGVWSGPGVQFLGGDSYSFNPTIAGAGNHMVYFNKNNCTDSLRIDIYDPNLNVDEIAFCSLDPILELDPSATFGGTWSGSGIVNTTTGLFNPSLSSGGDYFVYWTNPAGCNDSIFITVEVFEEATIDNLNENYCVLNQLYEFETLPENGIISGSLTTNSFNPSLLGEGNYEVIYTYQGDYCPVTTTTVNFIVHPGLDNVLTANDSTLCQDQQVTITAATSGGYPSTSGYSYQWSTGGLAFNSTTTALSTSQFVYVTINDGCGPSFTDSIFIEILAPIQTLVTTSEMLCTGEEGFASVAITPVGGDYVVSWNNTISPTLTAPAGTSWQLVVEDLSTGCSTSPETVIIPSFPNVNANFLVTPNSACISFEEANAVQIIDLSQNATLGTWTFGNGVEALYSPGQSLTQSYSLADNYEITLIAMNDAGCMDTSIYSFCILPEIPVFVPDIFSPNGDGNNDVLFVRGNGLARIDFRIFNRWGEEVFVSTDPTRGWDGQLRGSPSPSGSYFYTLKVRLSSEAIINLTGEIILVR